MDDRLKSDVTPLGNIQPISPTIKERIIHDKKEREKEKEKEKEKKDKREKDRFESQPEDSQEPKIISHKHDEKPESGVGGIIDITVE